MTGNKLPLPDASVADTGLPDWRRRVDAPDPDDELLPRTPPDVESVLGFDPLELLQITDAVFEETKHPRGQPKNKGQFAPKGGGGYAGTEAVGQQPGQHQRGARPAAAPAGRQGTATANPAQQPGVNRTAGAGNVGGHGSAVAFKPVSDPGVFYRAIVAAKSANPTIGAAVHAYDTDEYADMRMFLTPDRTAGFALKGDDIVSVFKHPDSPYKQVARHALELAIKNGGKRLDCFDTVLPYFYSSNHFRAVARTKFADEYAPEGWDYKGMAPFNNGRPDVVFMVYDPDHKQLYKPGEGSMAADYDSAQMMQQEAVKRPGAKRGSKLQRIHQLLGHAAVTP